MKKLPPQFHFSDPNTFKSFMRQDELGHFNADRATQISDTELLASTKGRLHIIKVNQNRLFEIPDSISVCSNILPLNLKDFLRT